MKFFIPAIHKFNHKTEYYPGDYVEQDGKIWKCIREGMTTENMVTWHSYFELAHGALADTTNIYNHGRVARVTKKRRNQKG